MVVVNLKNFLWGKHTENNKHTFTLHGGRAYESWCGIVSGASFSSDYGKPVNEFVVNKLKELGYTVLKETFSR